MHIPPRNVSNLRYLCYILSGVMIVSLSACAGLQTARPPLPEAVNHQDAAAIEGEDREISAEAPDGNIDSKADPRLMASLQLTGQGKTLVEQGHPDDAIRILERAVSIDPENGSNYYYLAEAWMLKKNYDQASAFNNLAATYFAEDRYWRKKVLEQKERIFELMGGQ